MNPNRSYRKSNLPPNAKRVFAGAIFDVYQWEQELYDGSHATFERLVRPDTVVVFPVLPDGTIILVEDSQPGRDTILTAPAGRVEEGETPEGAALRELLEETGYRPERLEEFYTRTPAEKIDWMVHVFIGKGCVKIAEPVLDPGERIKEHPIAFEELVRLTIEGAYPYDECANPVLRAALDPAGLSELRMRFLS